MTLYTRSLQEIYGADTDLQSFYSPFNDYIVETSHDRGISVAEVHKILGDTKSAIDQGYLDSSGWYLTQLGAEVIADIHHSLGYEPTCP
jgi:hypothetical protein